MVNTSTLRIPMRRTASALAALVLATTIATLSAEEPVPHAAERKAPRDLAALLEPIRAKHDVPALGGAIVTTDGLVAVGATGLRCRGGTEKVTVEDRWHLGSCTKAMTATLCAVLVEEKVLSFETTVAKGLAKSAPEMDAGWKASTLNLLLHNRGGVSSDVPPALWGSLYRTDRSTAESRLALVRGTLEKPPAYAPGTENRYANVGFILAGAMAEEATGKTWEELIRTKLFDPLGMKSAGFGAPGTVGAKEADQPWGHHPKTGKGIPPGLAADNPAALGPAGTVHATLEDWGRFVSAHLRRGSGETPLLPKAAFDVLHAPVPDTGDPYAMGWLVGERPWGGRVLNHAGSNTMWYCITWVAPDKGFAVLITTNIGGDIAAKAADDAAGALIREHLRPK